MHFVSVPGNAGASRRCSNFTAHVQCVGENQFYMCVCLYLYIDAFQALTQKLFLLSLYLFVWMIIESST